MVECQLPKLTPTVATHAAASTSDEGTATPSTSSRAQNPGTSGGSDPDLQAVIDAWPTLPEAIQAGVLALVRATGIAPGR